MFIATAMISLVFTEADAYSVMIIVSMFLSAVGDYLLSKKSRHRLKIGGGIFMLAHICFIAAFITAAGFHWQVIPVALVLLILELAAAKLLKIKTRGVSADMMLYIVVVTTMAVCAASMLLTGEFNLQMSNISRNLTIIGAFLFLISDCIWMTYGMIFSSSKPILKIANVLTYFPAQMLIAGALIFR